MPWSVERDGSAVHVQITHPMDAQWEPLLDAIDAQLTPIPYAVYLPSDIEDASDEDRGMLKELWRMLQNRQIVILPPP
jgi:hypothetical protein